VQISPDKITAHLERAGLAPAYLIFGDEPLQALESADKVRAAARAAGVDERVLFEVDSGFDWQDIRAGLSEMSLFSTRRLIEIRMHARKPDKTAGALLVDLLERGDGMDTILVTAEKLDQNAQKAGWCRAIDKHGVVVQSRAIKPAQLENWIVQRARRAGLSVSAAAAELIALRAEGNLLAIAQEIDKLRLLVDGNEVDADTVLGAVVDNARYDVFGLIDVTLGGDTAKAIRMLRGLREEGVEPVFIGWAFNRELRKLVQMAAAVAVGKSVQSVLNEHNVWSTRTHMIRQTLERAPLDRLTQLFLDSIRLDRVIKGVRPGNPWDELELLCVRLASRWQFELTTIR
jgi:DNA polymerase-3 subunit delta